ncbi:uncharacterized protein LOC142977334 [Anticarsia gemmatalis]|uniref:uncharacterized protein LOC142977334 n=1 Tax=Anticarsia gemmatalis TaxID=129554 RepID=UPI003F76C72F
MTSKGWNCCIIQSFFGHSLSHGVSAVGIATLIISFVAMTTASISISSMPEDGEYNSQPLLAINTLFSLFCASISLYQIIISLFLVLNKIPYMCSLWFVSHISILTLYCMMFTFRAVVGYFQKQYLLSAFTVLAAVIYMGVFIYFMIIVQNYIFYLDIIRVSRSLS